MFIVYFNAFANLKLKVRNIYAFLSKKMQQALPVYIPAGYFTVQGHPSPVCFVHSSFSISSILTPNFRINVT